MKGRGHSIRTGEYHSSTRPSTTPQVDLHGLHHHIGEERMRRFMEDQVKNRVDEVLVIHGHGRGVMREVAYEWIDAHKNRVRSHEERNNGGAVLIRLKHG